MPWDLIPIHYSWPCTTFFLTNVPRQALYIVEMRLLLFIIFHKSKFGKYRFPWFLVINNLIMLRHFCCNLVVIHFNGFAFSSATTRCDVQEIIQFNCGHSWCICMQGSNINGFSFHRAPQNTRTPDIPQSSHTVQAPSSWSSTSWDLETMDLDQLKREKIKMQIKVLKLQEEYYTQKIKHNTKWYCFGGTLL